MAQLSIKEVCRACLQINNDMSLLFDEHLLFDGIPLSDMISECTKYMVIQHENLPEHICNKCVNGVKSAYSFKKQFETAHLELISLLKSVNKEVDEDPVTTAKTIDAGVQTEESGHSQCSVEVGTQYSKEDSVSGNDVSSVEIAANEILEATLNEQDSPDSSRRFKCDECGRAFKRNTHLSRHLVCHRKSKTYQCRTCKLKFDHLDDLKTHHRTLNHGKKYKCDSCDLSYSSAFLLRRHQKQEHAEERPYLCVECGKRYRRTTDLSVHMRIHTGEKPFKCQHCDKCFRRAAEVKTHELYHTGEKKYICNVCNKAFMRQDKLVMHVRIHTGERPYKCDQCPKSFKQGKDLKAHLRIHTGQYYRCEHCVKSFSSPYYLKVHKKSIHGIEMTSNRIQYSSILPSKDPSIEISENTLQSEQTK